MSSQSRIEDLLLEWEDRRAAGRAPTAEDLCRDCPELLEPVRRRIADLQRLEGVLDTGPAAAPAPASDAPPVWTDAGPRYAGMRFHARGGLGEVFVARDVRLRREVALKRIKPSRAHQAAGRARFLAEAEITGRLEHPGIVPVYGLEEDVPGGPFYAMRFVRGGNLSEAIRGFHAGEPADPGRRRVALRELLGRFIAACNAVAYAHSRGILHRDLKPANIMLGKYGETLVVDWGLARPFARDDADRSKGEETLRPAGYQSTGLETAVGTPSYMSPEQAGGIPEPVGPAADIYSLGATLFTLLTGRPPMDGRSSAEVMERARKGWFPRPRQVNPRVPPALEAVCLKAMALLPRDRYARAEDLAADLENWLADEPVSAWREPWWTRLRRTLFRHQTAAAASAASAISVIVALSGSLAFPVHIWAVELRADVVLAAFAVMAGALVVSVAAVRRQRAARLRVEADLKDAAIQRGLAEFRAERARRDLETLRRGLGELAADPSAVSLAERLRSLAAAAATSA